MSNYSIVLSHSCRHRHRRLLLLPGIEELEDNGVVQEHDSTGRRRELFIGGISGVAACLH